MRRDHCLLAGGGVDSCSPSALRFSPNCTFDRSPTGVPVPLRSASATVPILENPARGPGLACGAGSVMKPVFAAACCCSAFPFPFSFSFCF